MRHTARISLVLAAFHGFGRWPNLFIAKTFFKACWACRTAAIGSGNCLAKTITEPYYGEQCLPSMIDIASAGAPESPQSKNHSAIALYIRETQNACGCRFTSATRKRNWSVRFFPSSCNFVLADFGSGRSQSFFAALTRNGILDP